MYLEVSPMYEKGNNHLTSANHMISNLKKSRWVDARDRTTILRK